MRDERFETYLLWKGDPEHTKARGDSVGSRQSHGGVIYIYFFWKRKARQNLWKITLTRVEVTGIGNVGQEGWSD